MVEGYYGILVKITMTCLERGVRLRGSLALNGYLEVTNHMLRISNQSGTWFLRLSSHTGEITFMAYLERLSYVFDGASSHHMMSLPEFL